MQIDRSNYEIWIIDWLDGNLSAIQEEQLMAFLNDNPDIREESEDLLSARINPDQSAFRDKNSLRKNESDILPRQFEYLCAAYLEGDLSPEQVSELQAMTENDPSKKRTFDLIQRTKLSPLSEGYRHKKSLIRLTPVQRLAKTAIIVLSTAAAIALIISLFFIIPRKVPEKEIQSAMNGRTPDTTVTFRVEKPLPVIRKNADENNPSIALAIPSGKKSRVMIKPDTSVNNASDSAFLRKQGEKIQVNRIAINSGVDLPVAIIPGELVAYNAPAVASGDENDEDRTRLGKFIAKTFREKILGEKTSSDAPLRAYEIAEAGVTGINKLLGWEMALNEKKDANGDITSIYFNSKVLKFNAPVKKTSPAQ